MGDSLIKKDQDANNSKVEKSKEDKDSDIGKNVIDGDDQKTSSNDLLPVGVIDLLAAISALQLRHTEVRVSLGGLNALGHGSGELRFNVVDSYEKRFSVINMRAHDGESLVVKIPPGKMVFDSVDSLLSEHMKMIDLTLAMCLKLYKEPKNVALGGQIAGSPDDMGLPFSELCATEYPLERIHGTLMPFCNLIREADPNFSRGHLAEGINLLELREALLVISRVEMRQLRDRIEEQLRYVMDGRLTEKDLVVLNPSDLLTIVADPFAFNRMFDFLPRPMACSAALIMELLAPEITVTPVSASVLLQQGGQSASKLTTLNTFCNIGYNPSMQGEISAFITSLLCPGYINFIVELQDIDGGDPYLTCFAALAAKLLLNYSDVRCWNNLTEGSVDIIETAILKAGIHAGIFEVPPVRVAGRPLNNVIPHARAQLQSFPVLRTTNQGGGWREDGRRMLVANPVNVQYNHCQRRPLYVCDVDNVEQTDEQVVEEMYGAWRIRRAMYDLISALGKGRSSRTSMSGADGVFNTLSRRVLDFFIEINDYNRRNWYTSLRLTDAAMANIYQGVDETPCAVRISGKTLLFLLKSLGKGTIGERRADYLTQVRVECGMAMDCINTAARNHMFNNALVEYEIPRGCFTRSDILSVCSPKQGPICTMMQHFKDAGLAYAVGAYYEPLMNTNLANIMNRIVDVILLNPQDYGITREGRLNNRYYPD